VITCDDAEAELACPPLPLAPGFVAQIAAWSGAATSQLRAVLPNDVAIEGYSTHLSAAMPHELDDAAIEAYARRFGLALLRGFDLPGAYGIYLRPRPGRLELCGDYIDGERLAAVAALFAGSVRSFWGDGAAVPALDLQMTRATGRPGVYIGKRAAFGFDAMAPGRKVELPLEGGGSIPVDAQLRLAGQAASSALDGIATAEDLDAARRLIAGESLNGAVPRTGAPDGGAFGDVLTARQRPGFSVRPQIATWDFALLRVEGRHRSVFACLPRACLGPFLRELDAGRLDATLRAGLDAASEARRLETPAQTQQPGLWDEAGPGRALLAPEPGAAPVKDAARSGKPAARAGKPVVFSRPRAVEAAPPLPPAPGRPEPAPEPERPPPKLPVLAAIGGLVLAAVVVVGVLAGGVLGGSSGPEPTPTVTSTTTPSPTRTPPPSPTTAPVIATETPRPTNTAPAGATQTPRPTETPRPTNTVVPTETPRPTNTPTATSTPNPGLINIAGTCDFSAASPLHRPLGSTVTFHNQQAFTVTVFINAPSGADPTLTINAGQQSTYTLAVAGTYFLECSGGGGSGGMQIIVP
ncbi:MAG TPA: hypothetical protein VI759_04490, partial [Dehalococcoidia bacterium]|nr:hypothetical protein [Dehalococcoidia bacterium]